MKRVLGDNPEACVHRYGMMTEMTPGSIQEKAYGAGYRDGNKLDGAPRMLLTADTSAWREFYLFGYDIGRQQRESEEAIYAKMSDTPGYAEWQWARRHYQMLLERFNRQWVVISKEDVVLTARSLESVYCHVDSLTPPFYITYFGKRSFLTELPFSWVGQQHNQALLNRYGW